MMALFLNIMKKGVQKIYKEVASTYELANHVLTYGLDILWRKKGAKTAARIGGEWWLDVCSGTGEMMHYLSRLKPEGTQIVSADFSRDMLIRSRKKNKEVHNHFVLTDAKKLPFPNDSFNLVTISFATRNIDSNRQRLITYFTEFHRVLKPGGMFMNLETSQPRSQLVRSLFHLYAKTIIKPVGYALSGSKSGYAYLAHTIPRFYDAPTLADILSESGFSQVEFDRRLLGIAAIHTAIK
ncbi:ubiquinone/menaquinone biosynthesis methyltransferase [Acidobacteriota bacterium]